MSLYISFHCCRYRCWCVMLSLSIYIYKYDEVIYVDGSVVNRTSGCRHDGTFESRENEIMMARYDNDIIYCNKKRNRFGIVCLW